MNTVKKLSPLLKSESGLYTFIYGLLEKSVVLLGLYGRKSITKAGKKPTYFEKSPLLKTKVGSEIRVDFPKIAFFGPKKSQKRRFAQI